MLDLDSMLCPFCGGEMDERGGQCNYKKKTIAIDLKCKQCETVIKFKTKWQNNPYKEAIEAFNRRVGKDAVPVVRCGECEHHYWEQEPCHGKTVHYCKLPHMMGVEVFKEFYCYYGERKEGAD